MASYFHRVIVAIAASYAAFSMPAFAGDVDNQPAAKIEFAKGKAAYAAKKYGEAEAALLKAASLGSRIPAIQYYLGLAAAQNGHVQIVKRAMARIIVMTDAGSPNAHTAKQMLARYAGNCEPYCCLEAGAIGRFFKNDMPIKVYISSGLMLPANLRGRSRFSAAEMVDMVKILNNPTFVQRADRDTGFTESKRSCVSQALQRWSWAASENILSFQMASSPAAADIVVLWAPQVDGYGGYTTSVVDRRAGNKIIIQMSTRDMFGDGDQKLKDEAFTEIAAHEFGHAWGLHAHSPNPADLMASQHAFGKGPGQPTENDRTTLRALYDLAPDIRK